MRQTVSRSTALRLILLIAIAALLPNESKAATKDLSVYCVDKFGREWFGGRSRADNGPQCVRRTLGGLGLEVRNLHYEDLCKSGSVKFIGRGALYDCVDQPQPITKAAGNSAAKPPPSAKPTPGSAAGGESAQEPVAEASPSASSPSTLAQRSQELSKACAEQYGAKWEWKPPSPNYYGAMHRGESENERNSWCILNPRKGMRWGEGNVSVVNHFGAWCKKHVPGFDAKAFFAVRVTGPIQLMKPITEHYGAGTCAGGRAIRTDQLCETGIPMIIGFHKDRHVGDSGGYRCIAKLSEQQTELTLDW